MSETTAVPNNNNVQKTLVVFKPDAVQRGIVGEILTRFERVGLKIVAVKMIAPTRDHYYRHYEEIGKMVWQARLRVDAGLYDAGASYCHGV